MAVRTHARKLKRGSPMNRALRYLDDMTEDQREMAADILNAYSSLGRVVHADEHLGVGRAFVNVCGKLGCWTAPPVLRIAKPE